MTLDFVCCVFSFMFSNANMQKNYSKHPPLLLVFQRKMHAFLLLGCFFLAVTEYLFGSAHMIPDDRLSTNHVSSALSQSLEVIPPPVLIVGKFASLEFSLYL